MLLNTIRKRAAARLAGEESGFTLIELLVVMLIIGILAAIAIPSFFNQKDKAGDAKAKEYAHTAQVAIETYSTDHNGSYVGADSAGALTSIEPTLSSANVSVTAATATGYTLVSTSSTGDTFSITNAAGTLSFPCSPAGSGGCPSGGGGWGS